MLSVNHLDIRYGEKHLFKDVSGVVYEDDRIGLVGVNGTGKTTLMKIMAGQTSTDDGIVNRSKYCSVAYLPQEAGLITSDRTLYEEAEASFGSVLALQEEAEQVGRLLAEQPPDGDEFKTLLERQGEIQHKLEQSDIYTIRTRIETVLGGLGFSSADLQRPVRSFSGGWTMRLLLAKMLLAAPSLLLLDEPTNHLDLESLTWLENYLNSYKGALLIISHDRAFLDRTILQTWELSLGKLTVYKGNYSFYVREKEERRRIEKAAYANQQAQVRQTMRFVERFRAKSTKARQAQSKLKHLGKMELIELSEDEHSVKFSFPSAPHSGRDVLMLDGISKSYGETPVFTGVDLQLQRGDKVAIVGVNGAGKTTLLRVLGGLLEVDAGSRRIGSGVEITYFGQHQAQELPPEHTALETLAHGTEDMTVTRMRSLLGAFLFRGEDVDKKVSVLSGGEKSRLALARMIATPANCMLLDEPTNHLDMSSQEVLQEAMAQYGGTIVVVSHNRYFVDCFVNKIIEVRDGTVTLFEGNVTDYLYHQELKQKRDAERQVQEEVELSEAETSGDSRKEKRRREAQLRQERHKKAGVWLKKLSEAESRIETLESEKIELEAQMADPDLYQDQDAWTSTSRAYEDCNRRLDRWLARWEEAQARIDAVDGELEKN